VTDAQSLTNFKLRARATMAVFKTFTAVTSEAIRFSVEKSASNPCDSSLDAFDRGCNLRSARQSQKAIPILHAIDKLVVLPKEDATPSGILRLGVLRELSALLHANSERRKRAKGLTTSSPLSSI
jgi:hypothetical protein